MSADLDSIDLESDYPPTARKKKKGHLDIDTQAEKQ